MSAQRADLTPRQYDRTDRDERESPHSDGTMNMAMQDLVEGERQSGQDVRSSNGARAR